MCFGKSGNMNNEEPGFKSGGGDESLDAAELAEMEEYADSFLEDNVDLQSQEFSALNRQLDQLQSALDMIESRNSNIHQELLELLRSNREVRRHMAEESEGDATTESEAATSSAALVASNAQCETSPTSEATSKSLVASEDGTSAAGGVSAEASVRQSLEAVKLEKS